MPAKPILRRVGEDLCFTMTELAMDIGYPRSTMGSVVRGESPGRMTADHRAALVAFLEAKRDVIDALLLELL